MLCLFLIIFNFLGVQLFHVFFGQDAKILFEAGGEVLRVLESYLVGEVADTHGGVFLRQPAGFFHADVADEGIDVHAGDGTELVVEGRRAGTHIGSKGVAVVAAVVEMLVDAVQGLLQELLFGRHDNLRHVIIVLARSLDKVLRGKTAVFDDGVDK